jgi:hypothetical protein
MIKFTRFPWDVQVIGSYVVPLDELGQQHQRMLDHGSDKEAGAIRRNRPQDWSRENDNIVRVFRPTPRSRQVSHRR